MYLVCVYVKSYSLTLYEFFNHQDLSAIETERNAVFYSKHTPLSPFLRFAVQSEIFCKSLQYRYKRHKKLLAIVSTFASREFVLVEGGGVEPPSGVISVHPARYRRNSSSSGGSSG